MTEKENSCILYENAGAVGLPIEKSRKSLLIKAVICVTVAGILIFGMFAAASFVKGDGKIVGAISEIALKLGFMGGRGQSGGNDVLLPEDTEIGGNDTDNEEETESFPEDSEETANGGENEEVTEDDRAETVDLSRAEMGDGYFYNYSSKIVDAEGMLASGFAGARHSFTEQPLVMIIHTYTSQGYSDLDEDDPYHMLTKSVVAVGDRLTVELGKRGIATIHVTVIHDGEGQNAYEATQKTLKTMLDIYPSVELVIDLNRLDVKDESGKEIRPLSPDGAAQIRLTVSTSGKLWRDDMSLALSLRRELNRNGANLCMPVTLSDSAYNSGLSLYYVKVDVGGKANSSSEALLATSSFAEAIEDVLKK